MKRYKPIFTEAKQVGVLYHFTDVKHIGSILKNNSLKGYTTSGLGYKTISFTRASELKDLTGEIWGSVRIIVDGNKLSNNYKIVPFFDLENLKGEYEHINPRYSEFEEMAITDEIKHLSKYILRIEILESKLHIITDSGIGQYYDRIEDTLKYLPKPEVKIKIVKKFIPYHRIKESIEIPLEKGDKFVYGKWKNKMAVYDSHYFNTKGDLIIITDTGKEIPAAKIRMVK